MSTSSFQPTGALLRVIARAAPPHERASNPCFAPMPQQAHQSERLLAWTKLLVGDDAEQLDALLAAYGRSRDEFAAGLADVLVVDPGQLPAWARSLVRLIDADGDAEAASDPYALFMRLGRHDLLQLDPQHELLTAQALDDLLAMLRRRLFQPCIQVLRYEMLAMSAWGGSRESAAQSAFNGTNSAWMRRFELYPVLAYIVGVVYTNWHTFAAELLGRLAADRDVLAEQLFAGVPGGPVAGVKGDVGDMHNHGRSVAVLTFASGGKAVYKPKDLRIAAAYMDLVRALNPYLELPLMARTILTRGSYAWEAHIAPAACQAEQQVAHFYRRMGMTIRLLQMLEARDFWLDNLIACGDQPVFIDLEMLLQPRDHPIRPLAPAEREAQRRVEESVVLTCTVTMPTVIGMGVSAEDLGALNSQQHFLTPFKAQLSGDLTKAASPDQYRTWEHTEHVPTLNGTPMTVDGYVDELLAGYQAMHDCLYARREVLLGADSPLRAMACVPVRFIHRDTWTYYQILQWSLAPSRMTDGVRREQFLLQMLRMAYQQHGAQPQALRLAASEIAGIRENDVPFFQCLPCGPAVLTVEGAPIEGYFGQNAFDRMKERLLDPAHCQRQLDEQRDFLNSCLAAGKHTPPARPAGHTRAAAPDCPGWTDAAIELGDQILSYAAEAPDGSMAWAGLTYHPFSDMRCVEVLQPDILTGTGGLAIVLADLYAVSGLARFRQAARHTLLASYRLVSEAPTMIREVLERSTFGSIIPTACGALYGLGAQLYALRRCARALADAELDEAARAYLTLLPLPELCRLAGPDLVAGTSGLLLATLAGHGAQSPAPGSLALAEHLLRSRAADGSLPRTSYPAASALASVPDAAGGMALALARIARLPSAPAPIQDAAAQAGALLRERAPDEGASVGHLLARLGLIADGATSDSAALAGADRYLQADVAGHSSRALLDGLEVASAAYRASQERRYAHVAQALGQALWQRRQAHGSWFPETFAADRHNLSAIWGVGAVAHALLRLEHPRQIQSIRLVG